MKQLAKILVFTFSSIFIVLQASATIVSGSFVPGSGNWTTIPNGGFETGLSSWSPVGYNGTFLSSTTAFAGNGSAQSSPSFSFNGPGFASQSSSVSVTPGATYIFSGFINAANVQTGQIYIDMSDTSFDINLGITEIVKGESNWQFVSATFVPNVSSIRVRLVQDGLVTFGNYALFDEIAITLLKDFRAPTIGAVNAVSEPSTLLLLLLFPGFIGYRKIRMANRA